nr:reverse transcriptase domain-containing protein [Tanacetum cinerariifolium]
MEELCQPSLNGRGGPITPIAIQATNFRLRNDMIQQVHNSCQFHGLSGDDANKHPDKFLHVTQSIKVNGVTDDAIHLYLFPHSLTHHATAWFDRLPRNSIDTFEQMAKMFLGGTIMKRRPEEYYDLIENMTAYHSDWDTSAQWSESSSSITSSSDLEIVALKAKMAEINKNLMKNDCPAIVGQTQNVYAAGPYQGGNSYQPQVERETEVTKDTVPPSNNRSTKDVQPPVVQVETPIPNSEPIVAPVIEQVVSPVSALRPN